jgi:hypothetical protein
MSPAVVLIAGWLSFVSRGAAQRVISMCTSQPLHNRKNRVSWHEEPDRHLFGITASLVASISFERWMFSGVVTLLL